MLELHLTTPPVAANRSDLFADVCQSLGGKALLIELSRGLHDVQPMATFHVPGDLGRAQALADGFCDTYLDAGFEIIRRKLEFDLHSHQATLLDARYVEWHGRVNVEDARLESLQALCEQSGAHLSRNALRQTRYRFATIRADTAAMLEARVANLSAELAAAGWVIERESWEGVAFDSNLQLDQGWL